MLKNSYWTLWLFALRFSRDDLEGEWVDFPGIHCASRIINEEFKREIKIMAYVKRELQFNTDDRIAQLLLFPYTKGKAAPVERTGGFTLENVCSGK